MPNLVKNIILTDIKTAEKLLIKKEDMCYVDFNKLIKMPDHQPDLSKPNAFFAEGDLSFEDQKRFGLNNWYDWSCNHWGTKWNAMTNNVLIDEKQNIAILDFDTAWCMPKPIFNALIKQSRTNIVWSYEEEEFDAEVYVVKIRKKDKQIMIDSQSLKDYKDIIDKYNITVQEYEKNEMEAEV